MLGSLFRNWGLLPGAFLPEALMPGAFAGQSFCSYPGMARDIQILLGQYNPLPLHEIMDATHAMRNRRVNDPYSSGYSYPGLCWRINKSLEVKFFQLIYTV